MKSSSLILATAALALALTPALAQDAAIDAVPSLEKVEAEDLEPGVAAGVQLGQYRFKLIFEEPKTREEALIRTTFENEPAFAQLLETLSDEIALPQDVPVRFVNCGMSNALWNPDAKEIQMCYELLTEFNQNFQEKDDAYRNAFKWADQVEVLLGAATFILLHEIGHGLVDLFNLPVTGREEDTVDQLATFLLLGGDEPGKPLEELSSRTALLGAYFFESWLPMGTEVKGQIWADPHTLGAKRSIDIMCLLLGANPEVYGNVVFTGGIMLNKFYAEHPEFIIGREAEWIAKTDDLNLVPMNRAPKCASEYARYSGSWRYLIDTFMVPQGQKAE